MHTKIKIFQKCMNFYQSRVINRLGLLNGTFVLCKGT